MTLLDAPQVRRYLALTGQRLPIIQAPIGPSAIPELAAAVARAGGLGGLALTWSSPEAVAEAVAATKADAEGAPFFTNFVLHFPCDGFDAALAAGVPVVTLSWGVDPARIARAKAKGVKVGVQVGHPMGARAARDAGADFLIAQGIEAGGHVQTTTPLATLLPQVMAEAHDLPVIAAGGIASGPAIAQVIAAGAAGAMMGTRFVAAHESCAHQVYKQAIVDASDCDTAYTPCFDGGWPAMQRVLRNDTLATWEAAGCPLPGTRPGEGETVFHRNGEAIPRYSDTAPTRGAEGALLSACLYAGTGVGAITAIEPAAQIVTRLWSEAEATARTP
jgi:NAD(P)H-dependent flavin oxidoreductase YrpB (nitropropane dioxygenase family)